MVSNHLTVCDLWDVVLPHLPSRSRLYHLAPIGVGTPYVESLTGYVARLAEAHNVHTATLVAHEMLPLLGPKYLSRDGIIRLAPFWVNASRSLNGPRTVAVDWTRIVERLTLRSELQFLTLQPWVEVLIPRGLLRPIRAWCPACYEEERQAGQAVYEQLLWAVAAVRVCIRHRQLLSTQCPYPDCGKVLSALGSRSRPGYCSKCERWLGIPPGTNLAEDESSGEEETEWQVWVAENIGELLAVAPTLPAWPRRERIAYAMGVCLKQAARGMESILARALGLMKGSTWWYLRKGRVPRLDLLLRLCDLVDISLLRFLTEADLHVGPLRTDRPWMKGPPTQRPTPRPFDIEGVRQALEQVLGSEEQPPPSMREVGRRLDHAPYDLSCRFPELCSAISIQYKAYRAERAQEKRERLCTEVRQAVLTIHAQGEYPSAQRVAHLLTTHRPLQVPEARATWLDTLQELGW